MLCSVSMLQSFDVNVGTDSQYNGSHAPGHGYTYNGMRMDMAPKKSSWWA